MKLSELKSRAAKSLPFFRSVLIGAHEQQLADFQCRDFAVLDAAMMAVCAGRKPDVLHNWVERTKGGSKTSDVARGILWLLLFCPRVVLIQAAAKDADQASEILKVIRDDVRSNKWMQSMVTVKGMSVVNKKTGAQLDILTADSLGAHGARPDVLFIDEIVHIDKRDFVETLLDNAVKTSAVVIVATNPGFCPSWQFDLREMSRHSDRWYFSQFTGQAPWIDPAEIEERRLSTSQNRFDRLWRGLWVSDHGDALQTADIKKAITMAGPMDGSERGYIFTAGVDIGLRKDATALVVLGKHIGHTEQIEVDRPRMTSTMEAMLDLNLIADPRGSRFEERRIDATGRFRLAHVQVWRPSPGSRVSLEVVRHAIADVHRKFRCQSICIDPHQGEHLNELLRRDNVPVRLIPQVGKTLNAQATAFVEAFQHRLIDLYPNETLLADIRALKLAEKSYGVRLVSPRNTEGGTAHGDTVTALSLAMAAAKQLGGRARFLDRPLLCEGMDSTEINEAVAARDGDASLSPQAFGGGLPFDSESSAGAAGGHAGAPAFSDNYFFED